MEKAEIRAAIRAKKRAMTEGEIRRQSAVLAKKLLENAAYRAAKTVYFYLPYNQEIRTEAMIEAAWAAGKQVAVPKVYGDRMRFIRITAFSQVEKGYCGIPEPIADEPVVEEPGALVLLPGLAFDPMGRRIGYGGGYYDQYLAEHPGHPTLALCYDFQLLPELTVQEHDICADEVLCAGEEAT